MQPTTPKSSIPPFLKVSPSPKLLMQLGVLLWLGGGLLANRLNAAAATSGIGVGLAIEGLRAVSLLGMGILIAGFVKKRRERRNAKC